MAPASQALTLSIHSPALQVGAFSIVAAGSYVEEDAVVPSGEVWAGNPAKKLREIKPSERDYLRSLPQRYVEISKEHEEVQELLHKKMEVI